MSHVVPYDIFDILPFISGLVRFDIWPFNDISTKETVIHS